MYEQLTFLPERNAPSENAAPRPLRKWRPTRRSVRLGDFAGLAGEIAQLVGTGATLALLEARGGCKITIPQKVREAHPVTRTVGARGAGLLSHRFGGERIDLPTLKGATARARNRAIRAEYDAGAPVTELVWRFGLAERNIREILKEPGP